MANPHRRWASRRSVPQGAGPAPDRARGQARTRHQQARRRHAWECHKLLGNRDSKGRDFALGLSNTSKDCR